MTLSETTRNKTILAIFFLTVVAAVVAGAIFSTDAFEALLFSVMAVSAAILSTFLVVALD